MQFRKAAAVLVGAALLVGGLAAAAPAQADTTTYDSWTEDYTPLKTTEGMVFEQRTDRNYGHLDAKKQPTALVSLNDVSGLAYTVDATVNYDPRVSEAYAASYNLGIVNTKTHVTYARLVWEPYMQAGSLNPKEGVYTQLEKGKWWAAKVYVDGAPSTPFDPDGLDGGVHLHGSQSDPATLNFFRDYFGDDTQVVFFGVKMGTTSPYLSSVSSLTFEGQKVPLGNPDTSPYSAKDITAAVTAATAPLQSQLNAAKAALTESETAALAKLVAAQNEAKTAPAKLVSITGTAKAGKTVTAKLTTKIPGATYAYQWYVGGKSVKAATKSSLKLVKSQRGKSLSVKVTTKWTDDLGKAQSVAVTVSYLKATKIAK